eukprot:CAMPEP_0118639826 /NCGR_PEP_ID=MMETSP0785-20121206/4429_1 /TAXON_ID=91992 /ORGANISM="Bolidomonas pacifica, Strain CCMP 1866" /LENGTH=83 /DNA_ID=CAMNT_0006531177 /DNA_START=739 /DNA_END=990 /DNA_ORIENTATION=+
MKFSSIIALFLTIASADAFFGVTVQSPRSSTSLNAKHAMKKAAKGHNAYRPKKSRPSDIKRAPVNYSLPKDNEKPAEYTLGGK